MNPNSDFKDLLCALNANSVKYLVVGGYAVIFHGEPRYTKDIDIWVKPTVENAAAVYRALIDFGAPLKQLNIERADFEKEGYFVQLGVPPSRIDLLMSIKGLRFDDAWQKKIEADYDGEKAMIISKTDLMISKKESGRPQDLVDFEMLKKL